jgi:hypothetical protein
MTARVHRLPVAEPAYVVHLTCDGCGDAQYVARTSLKERCVEPAMESVWIVVMEAERDPRTRWFVTENGRILCRPCSHVDEQQAQQMRAS